MCRVDSLAGVIALASAQICVSLLLDQFVHHHVNADRKWYVWMRVLRRSLYVLGAHVTSALCIVRITAKQLVKASISVASC